MTGYSQIEILLVEDNEHEAELTILSLKRHNLVNNLMHIDDGAEALDFIFKLPKIDGLEVLRQLKADKRTRMIPVVVLTSSNEERDVIESYRLGVNSYIVKPVNFESFSKAVAEVGLYWILLNQSSQL
jgi:two-component system, response regulator